MKQNNGNAIATCQRRIINRNQDYCTLSEQLVEDPAVPPDLAFVAGLHLDTGHLHHGCLEPVLPPPRDVGVVRDQLRRRR